MKTIGINAYPLRSNGGGARFVFEGTFPELLAAESENAYLIFLHDEGVPIVKRLLQTLPDDRAYFPETRKPRVYLQRAEVPADFFRFADSIDLLYCPFNSADPRIYHVPVVSILHDIQDQVFPEFFTPEEREARNEVYRDIVRTSDYTITVSRYSRELILKHFDSEPKRIEVIYNSTQSSLASANPEQPAIPGIEPGKFYLYPANNYPHKNHENLLAAWKELREEDATFPMLILTGSLVSNGFDCHRTIENDPGLRGAVVHGGLRPFSELAWLYRNTCATLIPSRFEGFCMPALEARQLGSEVLYGNLPAVSEILPGTKPAFDESSPKSIRSAIRSHFRAQNQNRRASRRRAPRTGEEFSWTRAAKETIRLFTDVIDLPKPQPMRFILPCDVDTEALLTSIMSIRSLPKGSYTISVLVPKALSSGPVADTVRSLNVPYHETEAIHPTLGDLEDTLIDVQRASWMMILQPGNEVFSTVNRLLAYELKRRENLHARAIVGEALQVHQDNERSYECTCFFRRRDKLWRLSGSIHPEMVTFRSDWFLSTLIASRTHRKRRFTIQPLLLEAKSSGVIAITRRTFARCLYRNSLKLNAPVLVHTHSRTQTGAASGQPEEAATSPSVTTAINDFVRFRFSSIQFSETESATMNQELESLRRLFPEDAYLERYPDVKSAVENGSFRSAFQHYITHGRTEGRSI